MTEYPFTTTPWFPVFFITLFVVFWCLVQLMLSYLSGWQWLARKYKATQKPYGRAFTLQSGSVGLVSYRHSLNIYTTHEGFFISPILFFRIGQPLLFIPWSEIHGKREHRFLWMQWVTFTVGNPTVGIMALPKSIFQDRETVT